MGKSDYYVDEQSEYPWRNKELMHQLYIVEEKPMQEVAKALGCAVSTVQNWLEKHEIETRDRYAASKNSKVRSPDWLREQYIEKERDLRDIASETDVSPQSVMRYLKEHGIGTREENYHHERPLSMFTDTRSGYEYFSSGANNAKANLLHHTLLAIAGGASPHKLFAEDYVVHHKNNIQWDNRVGNLEVLTVSEHSQRHGKETANKRWGNEYQMYDDDIDEV